MPFAITTDSPFGFKASDMPSVEESFLSKLQGSSFGPSMPSGYEQEPDYGGRPPFQPSRIWPVLLSILLAVFVWRAIKTFW